MALVEPTLESMQTTSENLLGSVLAFAPSFLLALVILVAGWIVARIARGAAKRAFSGTNHLIDRFLRRESYPGTEIPPAVTVVLSEIIFWAVIFLAAAIAARTAELPAVSGWLDQIASWLPNLLIGIAIIIISYLTGVVAGKHVSASAQSANVGQSALMGRLAQSLIFVTGLIIGLDQIGVNVTLLVALFVVSAGAIFVGFSIAFGLGARDYVSNLIGARTAREKLRPGVSVRMGGTEGEVLEITATQIALETDEGRTLIPGRMVEEENLIILSDHHGGTAKNG